MITLDPATKAQIARHARSAAPYEACGLISRDKLGAFRVKAHGVESAPQSWLKVWRAENTADQPLRQWLIAPAEQLALLQQIEAEDHELVAVWHSAKRAEPSALDRELAQGWPGLVHVIVALDCGWCNNGGVELEFGRFVPTNKLCSKCRGASINSNFTDFWIGALAKEAPCPR